CKKGGVVPIRWVIVMDVDGTHRKDNLFSTHPALSPEGVMSLFTRRWSLEVTFQEIRASRPRDDAPVVGEGGAANSPMHVGPLQESRRADLAHTHVHS